MSKTSISKRARDMPASGIRKFAPFLKEAIERGIDVYPLFIGQPDLPVPESFKKAVREFKFEANPLENFPKGTLAYSNSQGMYAFLDVLEKCYGPKCGVSQKNMVVTIGGSEGLDSAFGTVCDNGDSLVVFEPFYLNYESFAQWLGIKLVPVRTDIRDGFKLKGIEGKLEGIIQKEPRTKGIVITNPNNPTGVVYTRDEMEKIARFAKKNGLYVIADTSYDEIYFDGQEPVNILTLDGMDEWGIIVDSLSKKYSLTGARIGVNISKNEKVMNAFLKKAQGRLCAPTLEQIGARATLVEDPGYADWVRYQYQQRRDVAFPVLEKDESIFAVKPKGAFYCMVELGNDSNGNPVNADEFNWYMLSEFNKDGKTTMIAPGDGFYKTKGAGVNENRIAFVIDEKSLVDALNIFLEGLDSFRKWKKNNPENGYIKACNEKKIMH